MDLRNEKGHIFSGCRFQEQVQIQEERESAVSVDALGECGENVANRARREAAELRRQNVFELRAARAAPCWRQRR